MKITFHIGAHKTDNDLMMRTLMRNSRRLARQGIAIPEAGKFRTIMREVATNLKGDPAPKETEDIVLDALLEKVEVKHMVLSYDAFMCGAGMILADGGYYARADRTAWLRNVFPSHEVRFALALRNPATHVPAVYDQVKDKSLDEFMQGVDPLALRWSDPVALIAGANPESELLVWCNEDTPVIWPDVLQAVTEHSPDTVIKGEDDILSQVMLEEGRKRMASYLSNHTPNSPKQRRRIVAAFLDKYANPDEIEEVIDMPGWDAELIEHMTALYEDDVMTIRSMPGVTFIEP